MKSRGQLVCQQCGNNRNLCIHHLSYDMFDKRNVSGDSLMLLCASCHSKLHRTYNKSREARCPKCGTWRQVTRLDDIFLCHNCLCFSSIAEVAIQKKLKSLKWPSQLMRQKPQKRDCGLVTLWSCDLVVL